MGPGPRSVDGSSEAPGDERNRRLDKVVIGEIGLEEA